MTTLTAVWEPATASVLLTITPTVEVAVVLRTDTAGTAAVRMLDGQLPTSDVIVTRDAEAAHGLVSYTVVDAGAGAEATVEVTIEGPRLAAVVLPETLATPTLVRGYTSGRAAATTVHAVIDRADLVANLGPLRSRRGELEVWCEDYATTQAVIGVYDTAEVIHLRQADHAGLDMYHVAAGEVGCEPYDEATIPARWRVTIPYAEVRRPVDPLRGTIGWDWTDVASTYDSWLSLVQEWDSWADLTAGPPA